MTLLRFCHYTTAQSQNRDTISDVPVSHGVICKTTGPIAMLVAHHISLLPLFLHATLPDIQSWCSNHFAPHTNALLLAAMAAEVEALLHR